VEKKQSNGASDNLPAVNEVYYNNEEVLTESANEPQSVAENADTADSEVEPDSNTALPEADSIAEDADEDSAISEEDNNNTSNDDVVYNDEKIPDVDEVEDTIADKKIPVDEKESRKDGLNTSADRSPKTGDRSQWRLYLVIVVLVLVFIGIGVHKKRDKYIY
jgi:hypothetical protein